MTSLQSSNYTLNGRLMALGAYSKTKTFAWALVCTRGVIGPGLLSRKLKTIKSVRDVNVTQKSEKIHPKFLLKLITKILLFILFKLAHSLNR